MIRDAHKLAAWEKSYAKGERPNYVENLRLYEALYDEARMLGVFPLQNPLEGLDHLIDLIRVLNVSRTD